MLAHNETGFWYLCSENNKMIKYAKTNPVGVDKWIDRFQAQQQRDLPTLFGVSEATCLFYGRAETLVDKKTNKEELVVYTSGIKHDQIGIDTHYSFISYFVLEPIQVIQGFKQKYNAKMYCHGDLSKLFSTITHRADMELQNAVLTFLKRFIQPDKLQSVEPIQGLQPYHSFLINFIL
jgi:hypothetical protein